MSRKIILASTSPRRKHLLEQAGIPFEVVPSGYEEDMTLDMPPEELAKQLAYGKACDIADQHPDAIVIGADTIVVFEGRVLGKPKDIDDAKTTLRELSGKKNQVVTGVAVLCRALQREYTIASASQVHMATISQDEIDEYIASGEPMDKAGSYAAQGKGSKFVERVDGDFTSVIGLPVSQVWRLLKQMS